MNKKEDIDVEIEEVSGSDVGGIVRRMKQRRKKKKKTLNEMKKTLKKKKATKPTKTNATKTKTKTTTTKKKLIESTCGTLGRRIRGGWSETGKRRIQNGSSRTVGRGIHCGSGGTVGRRGPNELNMAKRGVMTKKDVITPRIHGIQLLVEANHPFEWDAIEEDGMFEMESSGEMVYGWRLKWKDWENFDFDKWEREKYKYEKWIQSVDKTTDTTVRIIWSSELWIKPCDLSNRTALQKAKEYIVGKLEFDADVPDEGIIRHRKASLEEIEEKLRNIDEFEKEIENKEEESKKMIKLKEEKMEENGALPPNDVEKMDKEEINEMLKENENDDDIVIL